MRPENQPVGMILRNQSDRYGVIYFIFCFVTRLYGGRTTRSEANRCSKLDFRGFCCYCCYRCLKFYLRWGSAKREMGGKAGTTEVQKHRAELD